MENEKISLKEILKNRYRQQYKDYDNTSISEDSEANYCKDRRKELVGLLKRLGLEDGLDLLKEKKGKSVRGYTFYKSEELFINELLDERQKHLLCVRKGDFADLDDDYAIRLYEKFFEMYRKRCDGEDEAAYRYTYGMLNLLDIPIRKQNVLIKQMQTDFTAITNKIFEERLRNITSRDDDLTWLEQVVKEVHALFKKSIEIYDIMYALRQDEMNEKADERYNSMTDEEINELENETCIGMRAYETYINTIEVRELYKELSGITGEPVPWNISAKDLEGNPKKKLTLAECKRTEEIKEKLVTLYQGIKETALKDEICSDLVDSTFEKDFLYSKGEYMSSEELVNKAYGEYAEQKHK